MRTWLEIQRLNLFEEWAIERLFKDGEIEEMSAEAELTLAAFRQLYPEHVYRCIMISEVG
jgi:hypothetical protein